MARKTEKTVKAAKPATRVRSVKLKTATAPKARRKTTARTVAATLPKAATDALVSLSTPVVAESTKLKAKVKDKIKDTGKAKDKSKKKAKKALKAAKAKAAGFMSEFHMPSMAGVPNQVGDVFKTIGTQIGQALNTDVGRVMVAELLIYAAKSLTKAAAETGVADGTKAALLTAGAKIGAAAADAGAKMVETGHSAAEAGSRLIDDGKKAASASVAKATGAAGSAATSAGDIMREVAQVAVGAVGGAVVDAAQNALARGRRKSSAGAAGAGGSIAAAIGSKVDAAKAAAPKSVSPKPAAPMTPSASAKAEGASTSEEGGAPAVAANAGHHPPTI